MLALYPIASRPIASPLEAVITPPENNSGTAYPSVSLDDWHDYVLPYASECPDATIDRHVRAAAIEFCRFTRVWQQDLSAIAADGSSIAFSMPRPADSELGLLLRVTMVREGYAPTPVEMVTPDLGMQRMDEGDLRMCAYTDGAGSLVVWPAPPAGSSIVARSVLKPAVNASVLPKFLLDQHASDIAAGALGSILSMPNKPWTDIKTAAIHASQFSLRKSTVMLAVRRGNARSTRTTATRWF